MNQPFPNYPAPVSEAAPASKAKKARKGMAITALVLGIVALAGSPLPILNNATIIAGVVGVVFAIIGLFGTHKVMSSFGLALAVAGIAIGIALQIHWAHQLDDLQTKVNNDLNNIQSSINNIPAPNFPTT